MIATASVMNRANMGTSDLVRSFEFDQVFWSSPGETSVSEGSEAGGMRNATQQVVYEGLGERIVDDALNVSGGDALQLSGLRGLIRV